MKQIIILYKNIYCTITRKGGSRTGAQNARPPCLNILGVVFVNFWLYNTHTLWFKSTYNVYNMYFIHYSYYKNIGYVWKGIKTNPRPKRDRTPWFWNFWIRHWLVFLLCMHDVIWSFSAMSKWHFFSEKRDKSNNIVLKAEIVKQHCRTLPCHTQTVFHYLSLFFSIYHLVPIFMDTDWTWILHEVIMFAWYERKKTKRIFTDYGSSNSAFSNSYSKKELHRIVIL